MGVTPMSVVIFAAAFVGLVVALFTLLQLPPVQRQFRRLFLVPFHDSVRGAVDDSALATQLDNLDRYTRYHLGPNGTNPALFSRVIGIEEGSEAAQSKQRLYLDEVESAIMESDPDQRTIFVNRAGCDIFGAEEFELLGPNKFGEPGRGWENFIHPDDLPQLNVKYDAAFSAGEKAEWHGIRVVNRDGSIRLTFRSAAYPIMSKSGVIGYIGVLHILEDFRTGDNV